MSQMYTDGVSFRTNTTSPKKIHFPESIDLVAFCQLRWNFVWQRPQHLMTRWAKERRVFFIEEPVFDAQDSHMEVYTAKGVTVAVPHVAGDHPNLNLEMMKLIDRFFRSHQISMYALWYWTPLAFAYTEHLSPHLIVYDCMDELAHFAHAPKELRDNEKLLVAKTDVMFTGGLSLYEAKKDLHRNIYPFPSSIDRAHFAQARSIKQDAEDQAAIGRPRIGYFGVIDERMDLDLLSGIAQARPDWNFIVVGPVVKISGGSLPRYTNIHYLGSKQYSDLPLYLAGWDAAMMPFALNEATRHISPTKTPEYLAAGKPVVSTPIKDVIRPYGDMKLVHIAGNTDQFVVCIERALEQKHDREWLRQVDAYLQNTSWDSTWQKMNTCIAESYNHLHSLPRGSYSSVSATQPVGIEARDDV